MTRRPILGLGVAIVVLVVACGEAEPATTTASTDPTTTSTTVTTIGTTTTTILTAAEVDSVALFPDEAMLQDGTWAAIVFRQALECIPEDTDLLAGEPVPCETTPVLFDGESPGALTGTEVPVWLIRWPVLSYAESSGLTSLGQIRQLPTLIETSAETYIEKDGAISLSGSMPDMGDYEIETADEETRFAVPFETGPDVPLAELTGTWETGDHLIQVDEGGSYELFETQAGGGEEATGVYGFVALQDGLLVFVTSAEPGPCSGDTGVYFAEKIGPGLRVAAVDEPCGFRAEAFGGEWSLSSAG